ncbi:MAG: restriction endonuclease [Candidatus Heimdallarchaeota archaeon]|nr:restriction endonuclease [Candidatus Heimdallarchaeota archaeon]
MSQRYKFIELSDAPLRVDAIYESGKFGNVKDDPISKLIPNTQNLGGFRITNNINDNYPAFVILYTSGEEKEWPNNLDIETGIFRYYGDNREPGSAINEKKGNKLLENVFSLLHGKATDRILIPPFLIFEKIERSRTVKFLGMAVPGRRDLSQGRDLIAIWKTMKSSRFQNYEAFFTILDCFEISKDWLNEIRKNRNSALKIAPKVWKNFVEIGITGTKALISPKSRIFRTKNEQLPKLNADWSLLRRIIDYFKSKSTNFERCAVEIVKLMDTNFESFRVTRPTRDGGFDAIGKYKIGHDFDKIRLECVIEAKLYDPKTSVGVRDTSRLISRIKHREFGIFVTTSYISQPAYEEIRYDNHPIIFVSGIDIITILKNRDLNTIAKLDVWLKTNFPFNNQE